MGVFNETGHERWTEEEIAGSLNAHEAKEFHTVVTPLTQRGYPDRGDGLDNIVGTLDARHAGGFQSAQSAAETSNVGPSNFPLGAPRRLTPRECERLMGWPDDHTLVEKNGKLLSESARYRLCGNGVVKNVTWWIGDRLALALTPSGV
jgi:site-specific DNA-cytosine methylase